jgi:hypothetical protein
MSLARWPNDGYAHIVDIVVNDGFQIFGIPGSSVGKFIYDGDRPKRWAAEPDIMLHGFWFWDWADQRFRVASIDADKRILTLDTQGHSFGFRKGQWYYAYNLLSELDQPGEWYLDRARGILYFWPPAPIAGAGVLVSVVRDPIRMSGLTDVALDHLIVEACRGNAVTISDCSRVRLTGCTLRNLGANAVVITGGHDNGVSGCDIYYAGDGGVILVGGDRTSLTPGGHFADNNHIHHCSRWNPLSHAGIALNGVGLRATHNLLDNLPHNAVAFTGNDHLIEFNEIHSCTFQGNDSGAIYTAGADEEWTMRGHVIRYNYLHHIYGFEGRGCMGVYLDDAFSSANIYGNIFYQVATCILIGGGRDNNMENNVFIDCPRALSLDARGLGWMAYLKDWLTKRLEAFPYKGPLWSSRYPKLVNILDDEPMAPKGNVVARNISWGGGWGWVEDAAAKFIKFEDNLRDVDPHFVDAAHANFQLRDDSPAFKIGFRRIPISQIGPYRSGDRASWPVPGAVRPKPVTPPPPPRPARVGPAPVFSVAHAKAPVVIDGDLQPAEWDGLRQEVAMVLERGDSGAKVSPRSLAWLAHNGAALLIAIDNEVDPSKPLHTGNHWVTDDAVEVAVRNPAAGKSAPTLVLRGYPNSVFESSHESQAPEAAVKRAAQGVLYAARIVNPSRWTAEWRIPFASLGIDPSRQRRFQFNLSGRKTANGLWIMWVPTGACTWQADQAGILTLLP